MADEVVVDQTAIPANGESHEQEHQPGNEVASETGAEQTSTQQTGEAGSSQAEPTKADKKGTPWYQHRINELSRERKEEKEARERETAELRRELDALKQGTTTETTSTKQSPVDLERAKQDWMREKSFNDSCTAIYNAGAKDFTDFDDALKQIGMVGEVPQHFYEAVIEIPDGHKVLYHVGQNPELAAELLGLPPVKLAIKLADLKSQLDRPQTKPVSRTPAPIKPINGAGAGDVDLSKASLDDFMERRNRDAPVKR